ncbi:MAG: C4-type zinc ribbon domain-containing protein [Chitinophagales bacterium]|nr:hypothetical protein [Bacteroidota bacterium]
MATTKELTIEEKLKALYELQKIDSKIDEITTLRGELPMEVSDLEDEIEGLATRIANLEQETTELKHRLANSELTRKNATEHIEKYEKQRMNVKNNREYEALSKEIDLQQLEIQLADKKIKDATEEIKIKEKYLEESKLRHEGKLQDLEKKKEELKKIIKETELEEDDLRAKSAKASKKIEERLLNAYHRIRRTYKNGLAVVPIERESCGGCLVKVPPQRQVDIRQMKKIIVCENCGRILVDSSLG